jgi:hypothetical protein
VNRVGRRLNGGESPSRWQEEYIYILIYIFNQF